MIEITEFVPKGFARTAAYPLGEPANPPAHPATHSTYEQFSGSPAVPGDHSDRAWYITGISDSASVYCKCGEWGARGSIYVHSSADVQRELIAAHERHANTPTRD